MNQPKPQPNPEEKLLLEMAMFVKSMRTTIKKYHEGTLDDIPSTEIIKWTDDLLREYNHYIHSR